MFIATLVVIIFVVVLALVVRKQNFEKNVQKLELQSAWGDAEAENILRKAGFSPQKRQKLRTKAFENKALLREFAARGNTNAMVSLAYAYDKERDIANALAWFEEAASAGVVGAMTKLSYLYSPDKDSLNREYPSSPEKSFEWRMRAARQGDADSMLWMGHAFYNGDGVARDSDKALKLMERAGQAGEPRAYLDIAMLYYGNPTSDTYDKKKAIEYYLKALNAAARVEDREERQSVYSSAVSGLGYVFGGALLCGKKDEYSDQRKAAYCFYLASCCCDGNLRNTYLDNYKKIGYVASQTELKEWEWDAEDLKFGI